MLVDYHMHFENGEHTFAYLDRMIAGGRARGVEEFGITEHSHHFREFAPCYRRVLRDNSPIGRIQDEWLSGPKMFCYRLDEWAEFITKAKAAGYPVKLGIEVCYFPGEEEQIAKILAPYPWDYVTGSVHWLNGWGYDHPALRFEWAARGVDTAFEQYIKTLEQSVASQLFDVIGHPFVIGMYGDQPSFDLTPHYLRLAQLMASAGVCAELNTGMLYRYPAKHPTPPEPFLKLLREQGVLLVFGSDAHYPEDVGRGLDLATQMAKAHGYTEAVRFSGRKRISNPL